MSHMSNDMNSQVAARLPNALHELPSAYSAEAETDTEEAAKVSESTGMVPAHYELTVCVVGTDKDLLAEYQAMAGGRNYTLANYMAGVDGADEDVDAGFDLFVPESGEEDNAYTIAPYHQQWDGREWRGRCSDGERQYATLIDHRVKCCMRFYEHGPPGGKGVLVGYYLYPRSSMAVKTPFRLANSVGIIDAGYRGPIKAALEVTPPAAQYMQRLKKMTRLVQICPPNMTHPMLVKITTSEDDLGSQTQRGEGGFGSTGS